MGASPASDTLKGLRTTMRRIERAWLPEAAAVPVALGITGIDTVLGGGLAGGALHEIAALRESELPAATGFAASLLGLLPAGHHVLWVNEDLACSESGVPYGPGLDETGLAPERLITVTVPKSREVLWVMEEALRCPAIAGVIGEIRCGTRGIDPVATRRLSLTAAEAGTFGLLLRDVPGTEASTAATRWQIGAARGGFDPHGIGPPRLVAHLTRNRRGQIGTWIVEWDRVEKRFSLATDSQPVAALSPGRSDRTHSDTRRIA